MADSKVLTGITKIAVKGFKSLAREVSVDLAPLTILAGANSSGKSSIMQPLLLLKQTLDASYDPGSLLLNGPNVAFTSASQFLSRTANKMAECLEIEICSYAASVRFAFKYAQPLGFDLSSVTYRDTDGRQATWKPGMTSADIPTLIEQQLGVHNTSVDKMEWAILKNRCFLIPQLRDARNQDGAHSFIFLLNSLPEAFASLIKGTIHIPGLRGNPGRTYPTAAVREFFPGTFQVYTASVLLHWKLNEEGKLAMVEKDMARLGLAGRVSAYRINDAELEIRVSRLPGDESAGDAVSIADVGLGVSYMLPVIVALHVTTPGELVYIEEPEIHLHPKAQREFAIVLADAIHRGVRVVVETHSSLLLLAVQTAVAEGKLKPSDVRLHWFQRDAHGITSVKSASLDSAGAFGDWPEDFADVSLEAESRYLDAADQQRLKVR
jgi:AAA domain, putative AbiEii toxin, Type IV TA system/AAA ATPase domain